MSNYRTTSARLASMVADLAEDLSDALHQLQHEEDRKAKDAYAATRTKYNDVPLTGPTGNNDADLLLAEAVPTTVNHWGPEPTTYSIPFPPPIEYRVVDTNGRRWVHSRTAHGIFDRIVTATALETLAGADEGIPLKLEWAPLLASYGPVYIDAWSDEDLASFKLYGPPGERWGNPDVECSHFACSLGWGHTGLHHDVNGNPIEAMAADGSEVDAGISPQEAAKTPCTCGHPDRHRQGCPRYARVSGVASDEHREDPAEHPENYDEQGPGF